MSLYSCGRKISGITIMEILIAVAILSVISTGIIIPFSKWRESRTLDVNTEGIMSLLNEARQNTLSSKDGFQYGVNFESARAVLFRGTTFVEPDVNNKEMSISPVLEISNIMLGGGATDVVFERLTGKTNNSGTITLRVKNDTSKNVIIKVEPTGAVGF